MPFFFIPEQITVTLDISPALKKLVEDILAVVGQPAKLAALTQRLKVSSDALAATVAAHPDPDTTD